MDVEAAGAFPKPVTLAEIKAEARLADMVLVKNSRLSVQPVTDRGMGLGLPHGRVRDEGVGGT